MESLDLVKQELEPKVNSVVAYANSIIIHNENDNGLATQFAARAKELFNKAEVDRKNLKSSAIEICQKIDNFFDPYTDPILKSIDIVKNKQTEWFEFEDNKRKLEQEKANRLAAEREDERRKKLLERAELARSLGDDKNADKLTEQAENVYIPAHEIEQIKTTYKNNDGTSSTFVRDIDAIVINPIEVIKEMATGRYPMTFVKWDIGKIEKYFKSIGARPGEYVGIRLKSKTIVKIGGVK